MLNAVIYARYSSHAQRDESIEAQVAKCRKYAKSHDYTIIHEYCDHAISGKTDDRPQFQQMIKDAEKKEFQYIIMYTLDRFSRDRYDSAFYKRKLKKLGIQWIYTEQPIMDGPEGILVESFLEGMAEYYSANLARGVRRGMEQNAQNGYVNGGLCPLGFMVKDKRYVPDPVMAPVVKEIFERYAAGERMADIARWLNKSGYHTSRGSKFTVDGLRWLMHNQKYIGKYVSCGIETEIPAIVSPEIFEEVQRKLKRNKTMARQSKVDFILTGKLTCGLCGNPVIGDSARGQYYYYSCIGKRKKTAKCELKSIRKDVIEELVMRTTYNELLTEENIKKIATRVAEIARGDSNYQKRTTELKDSISRLEKALDGYYNVAAETGLTPVLKNKIEETKENLETLYAESEELEYNKPIMLTSEQVEAWLNSFIDGDVEDDVFRKKIIETLVNSIVLYQDKLVIAYNMAEGKGLKSSEVRLMVGSSTDYPKFIKNVLVVVVEL